MQTDNLWERVANGALKHAAALLESETAPTAATVETVKGLIETAISIEMLNLRRSTQAKCVERGLAGYVSRQKAEEG